MFFFNQGVFLVFFQFPLYRHNENEKLALHGVNLFNTVVGIKKSVTKL